MRILFLSHCVPYPPDKGDKVRAYHQLRWLSKRHDIHLLAIAKTQEDLQYAPELKQWCSEVELFPLVKIRAQARAATSLLSPARSITHAYFWSPELGRRVQALCDRKAPDAVFAYTAAMGPYADLCSPEIASAIDLVDIDSAKWEHYAQTRSAPMKWVFATEAARLRRYERSVSDNFDSVFVTTVRESETLAGFSPSSQAIVVRNGVDTDFFAPGADSQSEGPKLVFTGQMDYFPNEDAAVYLAESLVPRLQESHPELTFDVVGRSPSPRVQRLAEAPGVVVTGEVADIRPYLEAAWIFVAPLRIARGVQNKALEAAALNLPIVCSSEVFRGLEDGGFRNGEHLLVADDDAGYLAAIDQLLNQPALRARMGSAARDLLSTNYSWDENMRQLELGIENRSLAQPLAATQGRG